MVDSYKPDKSPTYRGQDDFSHSFAERMWSALAGRKLKWLAEQTGISTSMMSDYGKGARTPGADKAVLIAEALNIDVGWLLTGRGSIADQLAASGDRQLRELVSPDLPNQLAARMRGQQVSPHFEAKPSNDDDLVDVAQLDSRYGLGATFVDGELVQASPRQFSAAWLRSITATPPWLLFWTSGQGNSMSPTIEDGEIILCDRSQTMPNTDDLIWVCALGETGMIKRLRTRADHVKLMSDNHAVADEIVYPDDNLRIVGRVVGVFKNL